MKPWREIAVPHKDVLAGTFQQAEFAADITAVHNGSASLEYQDAQEFFRRTFITEGMRLLLLSVARRLNKNEGDPVIQLQTSFGGGKTHTILAVYHLATRGCPLKELAGIPELLKEAGIKDVPHAKTAVLDGTALSPGQPWKRGQAHVNTLWGELAFQLGGKEAFSLVQTADKNGTSPGKETLKNLLEQAAPCVILMDEVVGYVRQLSGGQGVSGGTYDSNLSFLQALTEAVKMVPGAVLLASLPESEVEAGGSHGVAALRALEKIFGRLQAVWKPVGTEEAFEIVRRRLFNPIADASGRDAVCRAFADSYNKEGDAFPSDTHESRYAERLKQAYPIHPEVFDRLYEDWAALENFQRTRGVLKLMAKVIYKLWQDQNRDLMIMPGSLPLYDGSCRNELTCYLAPGWDPVIERDIDGERAETTELEAKETRYGAVNAARRAARAIFLGSAPSAGGTHQGIRGLDRARVLLGCVQPGQNPVVFSDVLSRLADLLHYLNSSGDKTLDSTRFWFDTQSNLRREMEDRKSRFDDKKEVRERMAAVLKKLAHGLAFFEGCHIFTPHSDVPDDGTLRLVWLAPDIPYLKEQPQPVFDEALSYVKNNGNRPRHRANRLLFMAPDQPVLGRFRDCIRTSLAWESIVEDIQGNRLNIDRFQEQQAKKEVESAQSVLLRSGRECYRWLLSPLLSSAKETQVKVEVFPLNTGGSSLPTEIERICRENELVVPAWSPIHLRDKLKELYWKPEKPAVKAMTFWEDSQKYLYLPRLKGMNVLEQAIIKGAGSFDFFGTANGETKGKYDGFKFGDANVQLDDTLLLIEPGKAKEYAKTISISEGGESEKGEQPKMTKEAIQASTVKESVNLNNSKVFHGAVDVNPMTAKMKFSEIAEEILAPLTADSDMKVRVTVEIEAEFPEGVKNDTKRTISENANSLGFRIKEWE